MPHILFLVSAGTNYGVLRMSMPSFPPNGADMTREEALTMIIASIAMEELALSHILNAEGEKLQYILGTLPGSCSCAGPQDVLAVNKSVAALVEMVMQNQMLLKNKLSQVLEFCPPSSPECRPEPGPCPPPCPPEPCGPPCPEPCPGPRQEKSAVQLVGRKEKMLWSPDCRLLWKLRYCKGDSICCAPAQVQLKPGSSYLVQYTLNVCVTSPVEGSIHLKQSPWGGSSDELPLRFSLEQGRGTLHQAAVIHLGRSSDRDVELSLVLEAQTPLCVEQVVMDVVEL